MAVANRVLRDLTADARIAQLEAQLAEAQAMAGKPTVTSVELQEYKGKPVLYFQGPFRPFHMGQAKARVLLDNQAVLKAFVVSKGTKIK